MKIIVGMTGATGSIYGIRLLEVLKQAGIETHLVISNWAGATIQTETTYTLKDVEALADYVYSNKDLGAKISSGSFQVDGMIVAPCSMKSLASIRMGLADNLVTRSADVILKERKKLLLMTRETPLNNIHLENMLYLSQMGVIIFPPMPAFYNHPETLEDIVDHIVFRALDQFGIHLPAAKRWDGLAKNNRLK
ncbi:MULTISPECIES: non-oxidative hydroxyarylic acid decarboxylases subunit B [Paenibacillus]|uniref:non-oxidative hydroxyarylic acid decarboxylases subunit B n=1 Tax=Paenibacillus illinoisensis TaxID=59845 RepID=UPI0021AD6F95|nr:MULTISPECIES: non-oxidative hydroxyarylic acid decarboxylases subunit B [Paenibacillus]